MVGRTGVAAEEVVRQVQADHLPLFSLPAWREKEQLHYWSWAGSWVEVVERMIVAEMSEAWMVVEVVRTERAELVQTWEEVAEVWRRELGVRPMEEGEVC